MRANVTLDFNRTVAKKAGQQRNGTACQCVGKSPNDLLTATAVLGFCERVVSILGNAIIHANTASLIG